MTLQELREELEKIMEENGPEVLDYEIVIEHMTGNLSIYVDSDEKEIVI